VSAPQAISIVSLILALAAWAAFAVTRQPAVAAVASLLSGGAIAFAIAPLITARPSNSAKRARTPEAPPEESAHRRTPPSFVAPSDTTPEAVAQALLTNSTVAGDPVSAHIWVEDTASGTLRQLAGTGLMAPPTSPEPLTEGVLGTVIEDGRAHLEQLRRITSPSEERTVWRYAFPIKNAGPRAVAAVDFMGTDPPHSENMNRVAASMAAPLAGAVSLAIAHRREDMVRALVDVAHALSRKLDPDDVIYETLSTAVEISHAATASIMLLADDRLTIAAAHGLPGHVIDSTSISVGEGIAGWVAMTGQPLLVEDLPGRDGRGERHGVRSAVSVPIADDDGLLGVLNVGSRAYPAHYDQEHLDVLESLGRQAAVALRNAEALAVAEEMFYGSLRALATALETKDPYSRGGTERVADLSVALGKRMALDEDELQALEIAALLHDIGMTTAGGIRSAQGPLTTVERGLVTMHPKIAADILKTAPALRLAVPIVYHHHEHYDGRGYIEGIEGEEIPLGARLLSVVDTYVAMTSARPYREAFNAERAIEEIEEKAGTQFDPSVVTIFAEMIRGEANRAPDRASDER
jgi:HD-GYP domain-containing protein (c-di-GMP phosphodiesterase class II)